MSLESLQTAASPGPLFQSVNSLQPADGYMPHPQTPADAVVMERNSDAFQAGDRLPGYSYSYR